MIPAAATAAATAASIAVMTTYILTDPVGEEFLLQIRPKFPFIVDPAVGVELERLREDFLVMVDRPVVVDDCGGDSGNKFAKLNYVKKTKNHDSSFIS